MAGTITKDLTGKRFGKRVVIKRAENYKGRVMWEAVCDCGFKSTCLSQSLARSGGCIWCTHKDDRPYRRLRPYEAQYNNFINRARFPVEIKYEDFAKLAEQKECHYCGGKVVWAEYRNNKKRGGSGSNLDRKDYRLGYTLDNVSVCCGRCNYAKGTHFTYDEWVKIGNLIRTWGHNGEYIITPQFRKKLNQ